MSNTNKTWHTKEDILNDLARIAGRNIEKTNIDDRFAVRGGRPPPVHVPDEDEDEIIQMYGQLASRDSSMEEPDLCGITHMLRMVNEYNDTGPYDDNVTFKELRKAADSVITISKLNPNVPEFKSRNLNTTTSEKCNIVENGNSSRTESSSCLENSETKTKPLNVAPLACKDDDDINKTDAGHKNETKIYDIDVTKKIDVSSLNSNDIQDIREKLKLKIVSTSKAACLNKKRERNLAIASLLKLYTEIPKSPKIDSQPTLITPEYFKNSPADIANDTVRPETKENIVDEIIMKETIHEDDNASNPTDLVNKFWSSCQSSSRESGTSNLSSPKPRDENPEKQESDFRVPKEVEESVKKVNKWLNGPEKRKSKPQAIFLGPVTFKKKESISGNSSDSQSVSNIDNRERPSSAQTCDSFVPSAYANELSKSYIERSQSKAVQHEDMWMKLERQLQERDKAIKLRMTRAQQ